MDEIEEEFQGRGILRGRTYRYKANDALAIVEKCRQLDRMIYGIDVFIITDEATKIVDYIDYTGSSYEDFDESKYYAKYHINKNSDAGHWEEAKQFIKDRKNEDYYFEIVYEK